MDAPKGEWKPSTAKYGTGEEYWIGKIKIGAWLNPSVSRGDPTKYRASINLPTVVMRHDSIDFNNRDDAKARVERAVATWFRWLTEQA